MDKLLKHHLEEFENNISNEDEAILSYKMSLENIRDLLISYLNSTTPNIRGIMGHDLNSVEKQLKNLNILKNENNNISG